MISMAVLDSYCTWQIRNLGKAIEGSNLWYDSEFYLSSLIFFVTNTSRVTLYREHGQFE